MGVKKRGKIRKKKTGSNYIIQFQSQTDAKMFTKAALKAIFSLLGSPCQRTEQST